MGSTIEMEDPRIVPMDFTGKLNRACELRRLTNQRELAEMARVSKSSLNRWLSGASTPDIHEAARLAAVLDVPLDWLARSDDQDDPPATEILPDDEASVLRVYRNLKHAGALDEASATHGMAMAAKGLPGGSQPRPQNLVQVTSSTPDIRPEPPEGMDPTYRHPLRPKEPFEGVRSRPVEPDAGERQESAKSPRRRKPG